MSQTVAIIARSLQAVEPERVRVSLSKLALAHGLGVAFDPSLMTDEAKDGMAGLLRRWSPDLVAFLRLPVTLETAECPAIGESLEPGGERSDFLLFVSELGRLMATFCEEFSMVFAVTWVKNHGARMRSGPLETLIDLLKQPASWALQTYDPVLDSWWLHDEIPLVFTVKL